MTSEFTTSRDINGAFRIPPEQLRTIEQEIRKFTSADAQIRVSFDNGHKLSFSSVQEMLDDTLTRARAIDEITISSPFICRPNRAYFRLNKGWISNPVSYDVSGNRDQCVALEQKIGMEAGSSAIWWHHIRRYENIVSMALSLAIMTSLIYFSIEPVSSLSPVEASIFSVLTYLLAQIFIIVFFPKLEFGFGKISRFAKFRTWIGSAILIGYPTALGFELLKEKFF